MSKKLPIRAAIRESGETYRTLGEKIGISPAAVCEIVKGRTKGATPRYALAMALGRSVDELEFPELDQAA